MKDPLVARLRSRTRAYTLSVLAGTRVPQTADRIAKLAELSRPNVYAELRRLERTGIVSRRPSGWLLVDEKVRALCEGSGPLHQRRFPAQLRVQPTRVDSRPLGGEATNRSGSKKLGREPGVLREFSRSPTKDRLLLAAGLRPSRHRGRDSDPRPANRRLKS